MYHSKMFGHLGHSGDLLQFFLSTVVRRVLTIEKFSYKNVANSLQISYDAFLR